MKACPQTDTQSVWEHGESVQAYLLDLISENPRCDWKLPDWFLKSKDTITKNIHPVPLLKHYTLYHDCGKPRCLTLDRDGARHFPDHARVSQETYLAHFDDVTVANLIGWDMVLHTATSKEVDHLLRTTWTKKDAFSLILSAFSEVHSNAAMFGGINSTSFKIKWKRINQRAKQILRFYGML